MSVRPVVVVDATVLIKWYLPEIYSESCLQLLESGAVLKSSEIALSQIASSLWRRSRAGEIKPEQASRIVGNLAKLPIEFVPIPPLAAHAMELASLSSRTFNEALYFVLALRERSKMVTADHRWFTMISTGKLRHHIEFIEDTVKRLG